ncbi:MAG TPA: hypothetical protein VFQ77_06820 [Pseudonocardiaceae bacterium]|jgi:hypothetical protein|nr:hypothetical protein [Pseudonocardiaceae bacterium]
MSDCAHRGADGPPTAQIQWDFASSRAARGGCLVADVVEIGIGLRRRFHTWLWGCGRCH